MKKNFYSNFRLLVRKNMNKICHFFRQKMPLTNCGLFDAFRHNRQGVQCDQDGGIAGSNQQRGDPEEEQQMGHVVDAFPGNNWKI